MDFTAELAKRFKNKNKPETDTPSATKKTKEPKPPVKEEEDDDGDLFSSKPNEKTKEKVKASNLFASDSDDDGGLFDIPPSKPKPTTKKPLFGDGDDEEEEDKKSEKEEVEENEKVIEPTKPKLPSGAKSMFKDQLLESAIQRRFNPEKEQEPEIRKKENSDDEDDDLFKPKKPPAKVESVNKNVEESKVAPSKATKPTNKVKSLFDDSDDDDLFSKPAEEKPKVTTTVPKKEKSLFDDDNDDNDSFSKPKATEQEIPVEKVKEVKILNKNSTSDSLFAELNKRQKEKSVNQSDEVKTSSKPVPVIKDEDTPKPSKSLLFDADDEEDDFFSVKPKKPEQTKSKLLANSQDDLTKEKSNETIKQAVSKPIEKKGNLLFDEDDDSDDLFSIKVVEPPKQPENVKPAVKTSLNDDDDLFSKKTSPKVEQKQKLVDPAIKTKSQSPKLKPKILLDDDDENDLFSNKSSPKVEQKQKLVDPPTQSKSQSPKLKPKILLNDDDDDLFSKKQSISAKPKPKPLLDDDDDDDLFTNKKPVAVPKKSENPLISNTANPSIQKTKNILDDDDDDDLFAKKPPKIVSDFTSEAKYSPNKDLIKKTSNFSSSDGEESLFKPKVVVEKVKNEELNFDSLPDIDVGLSANPLLDTEKPALVVKDTDQSKKGIFNKNLKSDNLFAELNKKLNVADPLGAIKPEVNVEVKEKVDEKLKDPILVGNEKDKVKLNSTDEKPVVEDATSSKLESLKQSFALNEDPFKFKADEIESQKAQEIPFKESQSNLLPDSKIKSFKNETLVKQTDDPFKINSKIEGNQENDAPVKETTSSIKSLQKNLLLNPANMLPGAKPKSLNKQPLLEDNDDPFKLDATIESKTNDETPAKESSIKSLQKSLLLNPTNLLPGAKPQSPNKSATLQKLDENDPFSLEVDRTFNDQSIRNVQKDRIKVAQKKRPPSNRARVEEPAVQSKDKSNSIDFGFDDEPPKKVNEPSSVKESKNDDPSLIQTKPKINQPEESKLKTKLDDSDDFDLFKQSVQKAKPVADEVSMNDDLNLFASDSILKNKSTTVAADEKKTYDSKKKKSNLVFKDDVDLFADVSILDTKTTTSNNKVTKEKPNSNKPKKAVFAGKISILFRRETKILNKIFFKRRYI